MEDKATQPDDKQLATEAKEGLHPQSDTRSRWSFFPKSKHNFTRLANFNPFKSSYWALYNQLDDFTSKCVLALGITCAIAAGVPLPIIAVIFRTVVDTFPPPEASLDTAIYEIIGIACAYFVVTWTWSICWGVVGEKIARGFREALVEKAMGMEMAYFDVKAPDMTITLTGDTQTIQRGTSEKVGLFIQSISYFIATFIVGFILSAELTGILLVAVVPAMIIIVSVGSHITSKWSKEASRLVSEAAAVAEGAIGAVQVVQAFGANNVISDEYIRILKIATRAAFRRSTAGALMLGLVYFTAYAINALAFWEGSRLSTGSGAGTIYAVVFLILDASFVVNQFGPFIQTFAVAAAAGSKITAILKDTSRIDVYSNEGVIAEPATFDHDIVFSEVCFAYPARPSIQVLQSASFTLEPGTTTGIVGLSGSGKSTIASLLERLYDPESGSLTIGGRNFKEYNITSLRNQMALVDQTPVLFRGTILDNIRHGVSSVDDLSDQEVLDRCSAAAKKANADFIWSLPDGIHTWIGGSGQSELSGGQMQRVCLARALVREPKMLILDEPTSALDATSELKILTALKEIAASGCTIVMVAHRLATIRHAHNILVMGDGKILEQGKHEDLVKTDGPYKTLVEAQGMRTSQEGSNEAISEPPEVELSDDSGPSETQPEKEVDIEKNERAEEPNQNQNQNKETFTLIKRCLRLSRSKSWLIILGLCAAIISGALIVGEAIVFGHLVAILNTEYGSSGFRSTVNFLCLMFFVISLVALLAFSTSGTAFGIVSEHLLLKIRSMSLKTILVQDMAWFEDPDHSTHKLMASINTDSGSLSGISGVVIGTIFQVSTNIVCGIVVAHVVAWEIAVVLLSTVPAVVLAGFLRVRILTKFDEKHASDYLDAAALASEACENIRTVAAFGREADVLQQYREAVEQPYRKSFKFNILGNLMLAFSYSLIYFVYALAFWWGSQRVRAGQYTQEDFFILLPALLLSAQSSGQFFSLAPEVTQARSAARRVFELHDQQPSIMVTEELDRSADTKDTLQEEKIPQGSDEILSQKVRSEKMESQLHGSKIVLDSVELRYSSRPDVSAVRDVSLSVGAGQFIGIVGPSGAGKSTVVGLLERFYDPTNGSVSVDDTDIRGIPVRRYRASLSLVSQEPGLFAGSVSFNVGLGARPGEEATQTQIEDVCKQCGVHDFVISLPEGYNTECGQGGSKLSGGQKQRIAVARALLRNPSILLLDEATSALDSHSEKKVQEAIAAASSGRTTIVVAHRLSSVLRADRIFVFDNGGIAEDGTHDELYAKGGVYTRMAQAQGLRQGVASDG